jgi:adenylate cyclase, class 2
MAHGDIEIEIKVKVERLAPLLALMEKEGKYEGEVRQVDEYFTPAHKNYTSVFPVNEWLRLRDENGKFSINYKNYHRDENGRSLYCDEYETHVEAMDKTEKIFGALGIRPLVKVDKVRRQWAYKDYGIAVDSVAGLGDFVEIEFNGESADPKRTMSEMMEFLKGLGVGRIRRNQQGYPFMLLFPEKVAYSDE